MKDADVYPKLAKLLHKLLCGEITTDVAIEEILRLTTPANITVFKIEDFSGKKSKE